MRLKSKIRRINIFNLINVYWLKDRIFIFTIFPQTAMNATQLFIFHYFYGFISMKFSHLQNKYFSQNSLFESLYKIFGSW